MSEIRQIPKMLRLFRVTETPREKCAARDTVALRRHAFVMLRNVSLGLKQFYPPLPLNCVRDPKKVQIPVNLFNKTCTLKWLYVSAVSR